MNNTQINTTSLSSKINTNIYSDPIDRYVSFITKNWQKLISLLLLFIAGIWFFNEYTNTMNLKNEQASVSFSKAVGSLGEIIFGDSDTLKPESIERYMDEMKRLSNDFSETSYSELSKVLNTAYALSTLSPDSSSLGSVSVDKNLIDESMSNLKIPFSKEPIKKVVAELNILLYSRALISSSVTQNDPAENINKSREYLRELLKESEVFPIEAAMSYYFTFNSEVDDLSTVYSSFDDLVKRYPQIEAPLIEECARLGIFYKAPSERLNT